MAILGFISLVIIIILVFYVVSQFALLKNNDDIFETQNWLKVVNVKNTLVSLVIIVSIFLLVFLANYYLMIRLNVRYFGTIIFFILMAALALFMVEKIVKIPKKGIINSFNFLFLLIMLIGVIYSVFGGRTYFHSKQYSELLQITEETFSSDVKTVDVTTLPIVDKAYGEKLGSLKLGEYPGIGSEFSVGDYSDIIFNGKQYLVAPLEYRGFFKWVNNNKLGTPGYILIDKVTADTTLVNIKESSGKGMIYTPSAFFNQDLIRNAYRNGMDKYNLEDYYFEIDEEGNPFYILQYSVPTIFINGGIDIVKIAVVNAVSGSVEIYNPNEVPDWIESVYPPQLLLNQLNYWGSLQDGWINSVFTQRGVLQPSYGKRTIMNDGQLYYFTGLTSAGSDESTIGFVYMNTKTKESVLFKFPGATEKAAMSKVLTLLPQNNISTAFPIPINVNDVPTYFIAIKGEDGRILRYVFMSVQDLEVYGIDETKSKAYTSYLQRLSSVNTDNLTQIEGEITNIKSYVLDGNTIYWFQLDHDLWYMLDVSSFSNTIMKYVISLNTGDTIAFFAQDFTIIEIEDK
jgi:hypothetical protein